MSDISLNYPAILACAVANMVIGFLWFGPLFGKQWMKLTGIQMSKKPEGMGKTYALAFVAALVMAFVMAHSMVFASAYLRISGVSAGLQGGFWNWLGFIAPVTLGVVLWEKKSWKLWVLTNGYWLVSLMVMGIILALWK